MLTMILAFFVTLVLLPWEESWLSHMNTPSMLEEKGRGTCLTIS